MRLDRDAPPIGGASQDSEARFERCARVLRDAGYSTPPQTHAFFVPGRIEVLGKHTDYAGGRSLLCAVDRGFHVMAAARSDDRVTMTDAETGERIEFRLVPDSPVEAAGWATYPTTVARRVARDFEVPLRGAEIAFASNLPPASGMSSSSALVVATFLAISSANDLASTDAYGENIHHAEDLAEYLAAVESGRDYRGFAGHRGVGTQGGSEDHTAILCARRRQLVQYAFSPVRFERAIDLPAGYVFAVGCSGVRAEKTGPAQDRYNLRAEQARSIAELWRDATGRSDATLGEALDSAPDAEARVRQIVTASARSRAERRELMDRLDQFIAESREIVPAAAEALAGSDFARFGELVYRSQELAERVLGNQVEETAHLARSARRCGAVAASAFGAGFGGSVWALVERADTSEFLAMWQADYFQRFPDRRGGACFFATNAAGPARRWP